MQQFVEKQAVVSRQLFLVTGSWSLVVHSFLAPCTRSPLSAVFPRPLALPGHVGTPYLGGSASGFFLLVMLAVAIIMQRGPEPTLTRENAMDWRERIVIDSEVLVGKPVVKGTRMAVEFIVELLAEGWTHEQVLKNYPQLAPQDIQAALQYASELMKHEKIYPLVV